MCGIFGMVTERSPELSERFLEGVLVGLFHLSETRGKEASGIAALHGAQIDL
jgi:glutamine phosphoribosylpyrophosphate amidotransferase